MLIAFNNPPESGGKLKGLSYQIPFPGEANATLHNEKYPLPRYPAADDDAVRLGIATRPRTGGPATNSPVTPPVVRSDPKPGGDSIAS